MMTIDYHELLALANTLYAAAGADPQSPALTGRYLRAADGLVGLVDLLYEAAAGKPPTKGGYDADKCGVCGRPLAIHAANCSEYVRNLVAVESPMLDPAARQLIDDAARARRELVGAEPPTREWVAANGESHRG